jgi:hypothetical protein
MQDIVDTQLLITTAISKKYQINNTAFMFLKEGPAWKNRCTRAAIKELTSSTSYAPPEFAGSGPANSTELHLLAEILPGADYPLSQPLITGDVFQMNKFGTPIYGQTFKPVDVRIIPGKKNKPVIYSPKEDVFYPADHVSWQNERFFHNVGAVGIPPNSSLVMVKIEKEPTGGPISCDLSNADFQLLYPHYYPITSLPNPGQVRVWGHALARCPDPDQDVSGTWLTFKFPSVNPDRSELMLSIRGEKSWNFWNLAE